MASTKNLDQFRSASLATARSLTDIAGAAPPLLADHCIVQAEAQPCRYRSDGDDPTATAGALLAVGASVTVPRSEFPNFKIIETAASAAVNITFKQTG